MLLHESDVLTASTYCLKEPRGFVEMKCPYSIKAEALGPDIRCFALG
jgi:hypothetical protein